MVSLGDLLARQQQEKNRSLSTAVQAQGVGFEIEKQRQAQLDAEKKAERESAFNPVLSLAGAIAGGLTGGVGGAVLGLGQGIGAGERTTLEKAIGSSVGGFGAGKLFAEPTAQQKTLAALTGQSTPSLSPQDLVQLGTGAMGGTQGIAQAVGGIATRRKTNEQQGLQNLLTKAKIQDLTNKDLKLGTPTVVQDKDGNEINAVFDKANNQYIEVGTNNILKNVTPKEKPTITQQVLDALSEKKKATLTAEQEFQMESTRPLILELINKTLKVPASGRIGGAGKEAAAQVGADPLVRDLESFKKGIAGPIARSILQEKGVLREEDIQRAMSIFPSAFQTEKERLLSMTTLMRLGKFSDNEIKEALGIDNLPDKLELKKYAEGSLATENILEQKAQTQAEAISLLEGKPIGTKIWVEELNDFLEVD